MLSGGLSLDVHGFGLVILSGDLVYRRRVLLLRLKETFSRMPEAEPCAELG